MNLDPGSELVRTPYDGNTKGLPREGQSRKRGEHAKQPVLWTWHRTKDTGEIWGKLPIGVLAWAYGVLRVRDSSEILHVCSGGLDANTRGVRVDIRREVLPDVCADGRALPFAPESFDAVLIDPPYSVEYAESLYGTNYPRPSHLLSEASRVLRPGKLVGIVHFLVPRPVAGLRICEVLGVTTGCGYRIRALTVYQAPQRALPGMPA